MVGPGELSGDNDGKDTRDLAELGVTRDCFLDLERPLPNRCSLVDACEVFRSRWPSLLISILIAYGCEFGKNYDKVKTVAQNDSDVAPQGGSCDQSGLKAFVMIC